MLLTSPEHIPKLPKVPDTLAIHEFLFQDGFGRHPKSESQPPFICGVTGRSFTISEVETRVELLARALSAKLGWRVNEGTEMYKVVGIYALNTVGSRAMHASKHNERAEAEPQSE